MGGEDPRAAVAEAQGLGQGLWCWWGREARLVWVAVPSLLAFLMRGAVTALPSEETDILQGTLLGCIVMRVLLF